MTVAYWDDRAKFDAWFAAAREGWTGEQRASGEFGTFIEVLYPWVEGYETLFSSLGRAEGVAALADGMSGEIQEHAYWGGMRDRIPLSQTSEMAPAGAARAVRDGARVRVVPHDNLCLIRSGQDWGGHRSLRTQDVPGGLSSRCCAKAWIFCATRAARSAATPTAT